MNQIDYFSPPTGSLNVYYEGSKVDLLVIPQLWAERLKSDRPKPCIMISIVSPENPQANLEHPEIFKDILRLKFHDLEYPIEEYKYCKLFSEVDAKLILEFVNKYINEIKMIVVHCEAGISRSAGVAAALSLIFNGDCGFFHENFHPNILVKSTILREANYYNFEEE